MTIMHDDDGRRITVSTSQDGPQDVIESLTAVRIENERMAAWRNLDDASRHMVQAVVRAALRRLLENPGWVPSSTRLGADRLDVFLVVELDVDQMHAAQAAQDLELELAAARQQLAELVVQLEGPLADRRPVGFVKHNGCGEIIFRQAGHPSNDPDEPWTPVWPAPVEEDAGVQTP